MKVFKFGGGSVKDAEGVRNIVTILKHEGFSNGLIVVSAMGKMTNAFETIVDAYYYRSNNLKPAIEFVETYHFAILDELFDDKKHRFRLEIKNLLTQMNTDLSLNKSRDYNFIYDQIVGYGELLSTKIISTYLNEKGFENSWIDVRAFIATDSNFREAKVDWKQTQEQIATLDSKELYITQGFIASDSSGATTTLGREGSDYSAAIFANCLNAGKLTIWKDVAGLLNSDPRYFENSQLVEQISYKEAIEMSYFGASVIHPKTLKPLENEDIPLLVRSFLDFKSGGTVIRKKAALIPKIPCYMVKKSQLWVSIYTMDFSLMLEHHMSELNSLWHKYRLRVNLIQNSAMGITLCIEDKLDTFQKFLTELKENYVVNFIDNVDLYTIRHANAEAINKIEQRGEVLLKQITKETVQIIILNLS